MGGHQGTMNRTSESSGLKKMLSKGFSPCSVNYNRRSRKTTSSVSSHKSISDAKLVDHKPPDSNLYDMNVDEYSTLETQISLPKNVRPITYVGLPLQAKPRDTGVYTSNYTPHIPPSYTSHLPQSPPSFTPPLSQKTYADTYTRPSYPQNYLHPAPQEPRQIKVVSSNNMNRFYNTAQERNFDLVDNKIDKSQSFRISEEEREYVDTLYRMMPSVRYVVFPADTSTQTEAPQAAPTPLPSNKSDILKHVPSNISAYCDGQKIIDTIKKELKNPNEKNKKDKVNEKKSQDRVAGSFMSFPNRSKKSASRQRQNITNASAKSKITSSKKTTVQKPFALNSTSHKNLLEREKKLIKEEQQKSKASIKQLNDMVYTLKKKLREEEEKSSRLERRIQLENRRNEKLKQMAAEDEKVEA